MISKIAASSLRLPSPQLEGTTLSHSGPTEYPLDNINGHIPFAVGDAYALFKFLHHGLPMISVWLESLI